MDEIKLFEAVRPTPPDEADELLQAVRDRLDRSLRDPAAGRPARHRRRLALGGLAAVAACAAIAVPIALPTGHSTSFVTAAYAVQRNPDGTVTLTIRQLTDPAGLEHALAAAGVPAVVQEEHLATRPAGHVLVRSAPAGKSTSIMRAVSACTIPDQQRYTEPASVQTAVLRQVDPGQLMDGATWLPAGGGTLTADFGPPASHPHTLPSGARMILHPAAMPAGSAVYIDIGSYRGSSGGTEWEGYLAVMNTSKFPRCVVSWPGRSSLPVYVPPSGPVSTDQTPG